MKLKSGVFHLLYIYLPVFIYYYYLFPKFGFLVVMQLSFVQSEDKILRRVSGMVVVRSIHVSKKSMEVTPLRFIFMNPSVI